MGRLRVSDKEGNGREDRDEPGLCGGIKRGVAGREKKSERDRRGEREEKKTVSRGGRKRGTKRETRG